MAPRIFLAALLAAQLADAATFALGTGIHGVKVESNGFAHVLWDWGGLNGVLLAKGAAILGVIGLLAGTAERFPRLLVWGSATATSFGLLGVFVNLLSLHLLAQAG